MQNDGLDLLLSEVANGLIGQSELRGLTYKVVELWRADQYGPTRHGLGGAAGQGRLTDSCHFARLTYKPVSSEAAQRTLAWVPRWRVSVQLEGVRF